mmetsp:Transcript_93024/g.265615  ORF Transcript_93024/g.265615 Transcript_93024/m.265615 type:complete len:348 (+) Transcript_93024:1082-2125(+)
MPQGRGELQGRAARGRAELRQAELIHDHGRHHVPRPRMRERGLDAGSHILENLGLVEEGLVRHRVAAAKVGLEVVVHDHEVNHRIMLLRSDQKVVGPIRYHGLIHITHHQVVRRHHPEAQVRPRRAHEPTHDAEGLPVEGGGDRVVVIRHLPASVVLITELIVAHVDPLVQQRLVKFDRVSSARLVAVHDAQRKIELNERRGARVFDRGGKVGQRILGGAGHPVPLLKVGEAGVVAIEQILVSRGAARETKERGARRGKMGLRGGHEVRSKVGGEVRSQEKLRHSPRLRGGVNRDLYSVLLGSAKVGPTGAAVLLCRGDLRVARVGEDRRRHALRGLGIHRRDRGLQ